MIKAVIIDDEYYFRKTLRECALWNQFNIEVCGDAANGQDGLELVQKNKPDIILADINMPIIDGLDFIKNVRTLGLKAKIIIVSGYSNFHYAKAAMRLGVDHYLLKPIQDSELEEVLSSVVSEILEERAELQEYTTLRESHLQHQTFLQERLLYKLLTNNYDTNNEDALIAECKACQLFQKYGWYYVVAMTAIDSGEKMMVIPSSIIKSTLKFLENGPELFSFSSYSMDDEHFCFVLASQEKIPLERIAFFLQELQVAVLMEHQTDIYLSVSNPCHALSKLSSSYQQASSTLYWRNHTAASSVIVPQHPVNEQISNFLTLQLKMQIIACLRIRNHTRLKFLLNTVQEHLEKVPNSANYLSYTAMFLLSCSAKVAFESGLQDHNTHITTVASRIRSMHTVSEMMREVSAEYSYVMEETRFKDENAKSPVVERALQYIDSNYTNRDLTIEIISKEVYANYAYLCCAFKKDLGITINHYITKLRIKKALKLMDEGETSVSNIAAAVGFSSANYFCKCFKKELDITPSDYIGNKK